MKNVISALAAASAILSLSAYAAAPAATPAAAPAAGDVEGKFKTAACIACHSPTAKMVGPAYKDIAAKYRGNKDAEKLLFDKVRKGGAGVWGPVAMPPSTAVSDADLKAMIKWILAQK